MGTTRIYKGFANHFNNLNDLQLSDLRVMTSAGAAYAGPGGFYADLIHMQAVGENDHEHRQLQNRILNNPGFYGGDGVYAGAAGFMNLSYMAILKPPAAILYDVNILQTIFWRDVIDGLARYPRIADFEKHITRQPDRIRTRLSEIFNTRALEIKASIYTKDIIRSETYIDNWVEAGRSFGYADRRWQEQGYAHLHAMAQGGAIAAVTLDVLDDIACTAVADRLARATFDVIEVDGTTDPRNTRGGFLGLSRGAGLSYRYAHAATGAHVSTLYVSNIFDFLRDCGDWTERQGIDVNPVRARHNLAPWMADCQALVISGRPETNPGWPSNSMP